MTTIAAMPVEILEQLEEIDAADVDTMDAPTDWDSGTITFDPYL
jgi:hypothetical protein